MCFLRFRQGVEFLSFDEKPVFFIFGVITPPYNDRKYFEVLTWLGRIFSECFWLKDSLLAAESPAEIRDILVNLSKEIA
jgi:hypothetical protein